MTKAWGMELPGFQFGLCDCYFHTLMESCDIHWLRSRGKEKKTKDNSSFVLGKSLFNQHVPSATIPHHDSRLLNFFYFSTNM